MSGAETNGELGSVAEPYTPSSCPALCRASTSFLAANDGRDKPGHDGGGKRRAVRVVAAITLVIVCLSGIFIAWIISLGPLPLAKAREISTTIVDRNGKLLRAY